MKNEIMGVPELTLAPETKKNEEAAQIANATLADTKFSFLLEYDTNQKEQLLSVLQAAGVIVEKDDETSHMFLAQMNMTQLAFIKQLDYLEGVKSDERGNPFLAEDTSKANQLRQDIMKSERMEEGVEAALDEASVRSTTYCPVNPNMSTATPISDEGFVQGNISCPGAEQWFKFTATRTGQYTICTSGSLDTIGALYDSYGNQIAEVDDYAPCGKLNFRIIINLIAGETYYVKVWLYGNNTGSYMLRVTEHVYADYVTINKNAITLVKGVTYELPLTPNYTYKGYNGAQQIPNLSASITPANTTEQKIWWWEQYGDVLKCSYGLDADGDRYIHVTAASAGISKLYAEDWNENGKRDECAVTVLAPYEKKLQDIGGFSNDEAKLILKVYDKVDLIYTAENTLQKAWRCARLLSEFSYDDFEFNDVAGSLTNQENRKSYFMTTLGYTENEYNTLSIALSDNHNDGDTIDFTHLQYSLAARLAYTLDKDGWASNLGSQFKTGNWGIYSNEDISYLGGWLGDATLRNDGGTGVPILKNDDYMADLDAENVYRLILQGYASIDALNVYYSNMNESNTRANIFLQYIPYSTVKQKIFYELIDAQLYMFLSNASNQGNIVLVNYYLNLINNEQYHYDIIKSNYFDTYDFLMSLNDRLSTLSHYQ